ncbi:hypothetical protein GIV68_00645 [Pseudomonas salomonii]|uniref:Uncharacterized protein n=1 Tax=Pseudomonas salomonii TaxID=191391 RepID=A0ABS9GGA8_9PSED|nr:hypothetical protein [Pseudomonas salomonii]
MLHAVLSSTLASLPFSHPGRYAMDIAMPEGTPIIAARSGAVVEASEVGLVSIPYEFNQALGKLPNFALGN